MDKSVLVVDDDAEMRDVLFTMLTESGYRVDAVADARAALRLIESRGYPVVITDMVMRGMNGTQFITSAVKYGVVASRMMYFSWHGR